MGLLNAATTAYSANRQASAAEDASRIQAGGVENAREDTLQGAQNARDALNGVSGTIDPRQEYLSGVDNAMQFTGQGYAGAQDTLNPLSQMAQPYLDEQANLLGINGGDAYQNSLSNIADPLAAQQEQAMMRNNSALGGVGGNVLSALADQTRNRTEANIGNRLSQLSSASSPALSALQQVSQLRLNQGLNMADIMRGSGSDLAGMETNRRQALANLELGQGSELAQLSQNLGNANAGYSAYQSSERASFITRYNGGA